MSTKSDPPSADAERRAPVSIMPATEGIDSDWGADAETATVSPRQAPAHATPAEARPATKLEVPAAAKVPVIHVPEVEPVRSAKQSADPPSNASSTPVPAPARSGRGGYVAAVALLAAAGIWWAVRSPEPEPTAPVPVAVAPPPAVSATPVPASAEPTAVASVAPATDLPSASAVPVASGSAAPSASGVSAPAASAQTGETVSVHINITPDGAKLTLKGEEVGKTPMTLELPRGERRVYEVVLKGYAPRRLVVDGTKEEIAYGLKPIEPQQP